MTDGRERARRANGEREPAPRATDEREGARERAIHAGIEGLGDGELLALVLGTGRKDEPVGVLASALLDEFGGLSGLSRAGLGALSARAGVGLAKGARVAAAMEMGRRAAAAGTTRAELRFADSRSVDAWARPRLAALDHEELWLLSLDGHHGLRAARRVATGGLHGVHLAASDPLRVALREGASGFVLVHNHPSGEPWPSEQDVLFTRRVAAAADQVGTPLLDHVIVARGGFVSLLDHGFFEARPAMDPASPRPRGRRAGAAAWSGSSPAGPPPGGRSRRSDSGSSGTAAAAPAGTPPPIGPP